MNGYTELVYVVLINARIQGFPTECLAGEVNNTGHLIAISDCDHV